MRRQEQQSEAIYCELTGVGTHNLKQLDIHIPLYQYTVVTGVSGSGKSSLVFDTLYAEAYRRYLESLSSFARQYLQALPKPILQSVKNLPPAIAVQQSRKGANNKRSTVGTLTEINDLLQVVFSQLADIHCPGCGQRVRKDNQESVSQWLRKDCEGENIVITAPLGSWQKMKAGDVQQLLMAQGFTRLWAASPQGGEIVRLEEAPLKQLFKGEVVVDRLLVAEQNLQRLWDSLLLAFNVGRGLLTIRRPSTSQSQTFSRSLQCLSCAKEFIEATAALFSFNHPLGACPVCQGYGQEAVVDWQKVFPDPSLSLATQGIAALNFGKHISYYQVILRAAKKAALSPTKPFADYSAAEWTWLQNGDQQKFGGMLAYFDWLDTKKYKAHYRMHKARFTSYVTCHYCGGSRYKPEALSFRLGGENIASLGTKSVASLGEWLKDLEQQVERQESELSPHMLAKWPGLQEAIWEIKSRLNYLDKIGLSYLSLHRPSASLSGGELQRIHMARCLGSALTDTLFCLDEPTAGLHARDSEALLALIYELRDRGNTIVAVEHDHTLIRGADYLLEIGPEAGHKGGHLAYVGAPPSRAGSLATWPGQKSSPSPQSQAYIHLQGARTHNLKDVSVAIPLQALTAVCGVSGSGKSSLIRHTLYPLLARNCQQKLEVADEAKALGLKIAAQGQALKAVYLVNQSPLGRSSRSNIVTYLEVFTPIRQLLAATDLAKKYQLEAGAFSFNVPGGRCEACKGLGTVLEDLSFLGEMEVVCPDCEGRRFGEKVLAVEYRQKNLPAILAMTVEQARAFFHDQAKISRILDRVIRMGLGYITLGQPTSAFSGGEAQRLKLLDIIGQSQEGESCCLIFDEPTTGLADSDVAIFCDYAHYLVSLGHTVVVIEHHLGMLRAADYLIELGPGAAHEGGQVLYQGPPAGILGCARSVTKAYL